MLIYWHKKDFRLMDNQALAFSLELCRSKNIAFLPIFGLETDLIEDSDISYEFSNFHKYGFVSAAIPLYMNYLHHGIKPALFNEPIIDFLSQSILGGKIKILVSHQEHGTNNTYARDLAVKEFCAKHNIIWHQIAPSGVIRNLSSRDIRYKAAKNYLSSAIIPIPTFTDITQTFTTNNESILKIFTALRAKLESEYNLQATSEKSGLACLKSFTTSRAIGYRGGISSPNKALEHGSRLSQHLAFGSLSLRYVNHYFTVQSRLTTETRMRIGIQGSMQRLHWREHFIQRIETSPDMPGVAIHPDYNSISYNNQYLNAYKAGITGEPLVDACMRCLLDTGFINFRMRALLVSYGVFGLDIDWRDLGQFLATTFLDYEPGIHWSQIQMQAGVTGINTVRVYSPHKQLLDQDPDCIFVKKWIPELCELTIEQIQGYNKSSLKELTGGKYPDPVVDFKAASKINKAKTYDIRSASTKESSQKVFVKHGSRKPRVTKQNKSVKISKYKTSVRVEAISQTPVNKSLF